MAKTNFVNGDPAQGVQGTVVTAEFLNALNNHRHRGLDQDGDGAIDYAPDTGAANAYVIALTPALTARVVGMPIHFMAANANTGASTLNDGLGAVDISKNFDQPLAAGDINAGQIVTVVWDGVDYQNQMASQDSVSSVRDVSRNLVIKNNTVNSNHQLTITADEVMLSDGPSSKLISALAETLDITLAGANGLDTGAEAASTWYHIWAIAKADGTKKTLASLSATAPTMPSGYTFKAYLGAVYNDASSDFISFCQIERKVVFIGDYVSVLTNGTSTTIVEVNISTVVPLTAKAVDIIVQTQLSQALYGYVAPNLEGDGILFILPSFANYSTTDYGTVIIIELQKIYYRVANFGGMNISVSGWEY